MSLHSLISEIDDEFDKEFRISSLDYGSSTFEGNAEKLNSNIKSFYHSKLKQVLEEIVKAAPKELILPDDIHLYNGEPRGYKIGKVEAFNQGRAQTLQVIMEYLGKEKV